MIIHNDLTISNESELTKLFKGEFRAEFFLKKMTL